jgi:putative ABC transport system permease protein
VSGIVTGAIGGYALGLIASSVFEQVQLPGLLPIAAAAAVMTGAAAVASMTPAARAARVDVLQALRSE